MKDEQLTLITDYCKQKLRAEFDEANNWEAIGIIDQAKAMGFDELAADMESDLKADADYNKQVQSDYDNGIRSGSVLD
jgi:hypothetical protein